MGNRGRLGNRVFPPGLTELPIGTGPFRVAAMDLLTDEVELEPNPHYWGFRPALDYVVYDDLGQSVDIINSWVNGEYDNDIISFHLCEDLSTFGDYTSDGTPRRLVASESPPQVSYMAFNSAIEPFDDVFFRRALVDSASPLSYEIKPYVGHPRSPASGLLPPGFPAHSVRAVGPRNERDGAVQNLQSSTYSERQDQFEIRFVPESYELDPDDLANLTSNWREWLGLDAGFTELHISQQKPEFYHMLRDGTLQMRYMLVRPQFPSPHAILGAIPNLFGPNAQSTETIELQRMLDNAAAQQDSVKRLAMYQDIEQHILDRALVLPMYWDEGGRCNEVQEWVVEFRVPKWGGSLFRNVVIDTGHPGYPNRTVR